MQQKIDLDVVFSGYNRVALRWVTNFPMAPGTSYEIWRSETRVTDFERIATTERQVFIDGPNLMGKFKRANYQVRFSNVNSNIAETAGEPGDDVYRFERRERFQLAKYDGVPAFLYVRRRTGKPCPVCVGAKEHADMGNDCTTCFGVGIAGGYHTPIPIYMKFSSLDTGGSNQQEIMVKDNSSTNLETSNYSILVAGDVVVEAGPPNMVWIVTGTQASARRRSAIKQIFTANEGDRGSALYHLPFPDFPWQDRRDMFFFDWAEPPQDFFTVFEEKVAEYVSRIKDQDLRYPDEPAPVVKQHDQPAGKRNPAKGAFS
jgi:hypothetical protein